jgi:hypothetical protein
MYNGEAESGIICREAFLTSKIVKLMKCSLTARLMMVADKLGLSQIRGAQQTRVDNWSDRP